MSIVSSTPGTPVRTVGISPKAIGATVAGLLTPIVTTNIGLDADLLEPLVTALVTALVVAVTAWYLPPGFVIVDDPAGASEPVVESSDDLLPDDAHEKMRADGVQDTQA